MQRALLAEFESADALLVALRRLRELGYSRLDAFTPYPVHEVEETLAVPRSKIPILVLGAGLTGALVAYLIQWACDAWAYPLDVGGRPLNSIPADIPICFETAVLFASLTAFVAPLALSGLPRIAHPLLAVDGFDRMTKDRFWAGIDAADPRFDDAVADELRRLGALRVERMEGEER